MQVKDVKIGQSYAVVYQSKLARLHCANIVSVRGEDTVTNYVRGTFPDLVGDDLPSVHGDNYPRRPRVHDYPVSDVRGPYEEHAALVAEKRRKEAEGRAAEEAKRKAARKLWRELYELAGLPVPEENNWQNPFYCSSNSDDLHMRVEGVTILQGILDRLRQSEPSVKVFENVRP